MNIQCIIMHTENDYETTLRLMKSTLERLKKLGNKAESYDQMLNRLIDEKLGV